MFDQQPTLELLFEQLGLDASAEAIDQFIEIGRASCRERVFLPV